MLLSDTNPSIDLHCKSIDWFQYERNIAIWVDNQSGLFFPWLHLIKHKLVCCLIKFFISQDFCQQVRLFSFCLSDSVYLFYFYSFCVFISLFLFSWYRSSHQKCSIKKGVLRNFKKLTGKHLCQSPFFKKVACLRPATLLKNKPWRKRFLVNFAKFLRTPFLEHL